MEGPLLRVAEAIAALGRGDAGEARDAMALATSQDPALGRVADAVAMAATQLEKGGTIEISSWNALADACPQELRPVVEESRQ